MERGASRVEKWPFAVIPLKHPDQPCREASHVNTLVGIPLLIGAAAPGKVHNHQ